MLMKSVLLGLAGAGAAGVLSICGLCDRGSQLGAQPARAPEPAAVAARLASATPLLVASTPAVPTPHVRTVRLRIDGMTCGGCVIGTRKVLTRLPGVSAAAVSYEKRQALVTYDPDRVTVAAMIAAISTLGYRATVVAG